MFKKILTILCSMFLIFALVGCSSKESDVSNASTIEPINIDFEVKTLEARTMTFDYPAESWKETKGFANINVLANTNSTQGTNINIQESKEADKNLKVSDYVKAVKKELEEMSGGGMKVQVAEVRKLNDTELAYIESTNKMTEESIDLALKSGTLTEEQINQLGGKEELLNAPETKQIQMAPIIDNKFFIVTGTYYDDSEKEEVLKAMLTIIQTVKFN